MSQEARDHSRQVLVGTEPMRRHNGERALTFKDLIFTVFCFIVYLYPLALSLFYTYIRCTVLCSAKNVNVLRLVVEVPVTASSSRVVRLPVSSLLLVGQMLLFALHC